MEVTLRPELERLIEKDVQSGRSTNRDEFLDKAVYHYVVARDLSQIINSWGEGDYKDIMAGVDSVIAQGIADPGRLGVMGASYGGFMTDWIVTQTGRFKAASTAASISDLAQEYYLSDAGDFIAEYFGLPWEAAASLTAHSAITHVTKVTTGP